MVGRKKFRIFKRANSFYYVQMLDPATGLALTAKSLHTRDKKEAEAIAWDWAFNGIPKKSAKEDKKTMVAASANRQTLFAMAQKINLDCDDAMRLVRILAERGLIDIPVTTNERSRQLFVAYLHDFWDYDNSAYVKDRLAHSHRIGKRHCYESLNRVHLYWDKEFAGRTLKSITRQDLKKFALKLHDMGKLAPKTINAIMDAGNRPLAWAFHEGLIPTNPVEGFERFGVTPKKKGILTVDEAKKLMAQAWDDPYAHVGNWLAMTTGMREGEIMAIQRQDIGDAPLANSKFYRLQVKHSWSTKGGKVIKCPKNGYERSVPLLPGIRDELLALLRKNPHTDVPEGDRFVFWGAVPDQPRYHGRFLRLEMQNECAKIGIDCKDRNISFHSWRHFYAARMADVADAEKIRRITGHRDRQMFDHYADHISDENIADMGSAMETLLR